jgi:hypothetical protein
MGCGVVWSTTLRRISTSLTDELRIEGPADPLVPHGTTSGDLPFSLGLISRSKTRQCHPVSGDMMRYIAIGIA